MCLGWLLTLICHFCLVFGYVIRGQAAFFGPDELVELNPVEHYYLDPNEQNIQIAKDLFSQAPSGAYVAVGTERGFFGVGFLTDPTHVILIDIDPNVVRYNRFNIALLKISKNREEYLFFRLKATHSEIVKRVEEVKDHLLEHEREMLEEVAHYRFWRKAFDNTEFHILHENIKTGWAKYTRYGKEIYLRNDSVFMKVKNLADQNKIEAHNVGFSNQKGLEAIVTRLLAHGIPLAMLDISNTWEKGYSTPRELRDLTIVFSAVARQKSLLFISFKNIRTHLGFIWEQAYIWGYSALSFELLKSMQRLEPIRWYDQFELSFLNLGIDGQKINGGQSICFKLFK